MSIVVETVRYRAKVESTRPKRHDLTGDGSDRPIAQGAPLLRTFSQRSGRETIFARHRIAELDIGVYSGDLERDFNQLGVRHGFLFGNRLMRPQPAPICVWKIDRSKLDAAVKQGFDYVRIARQRLQPPDYEQRRQRTRMVDGGGELEINVR